MDKAVAVRRADGLLVKLLGLEHAAFDPGNLRTQQRGAVFEILWAILCPYLELLLVSGHSLEMLQIVSCRITRCSSRERTVKVILRHFEEGGRGPEQSLCMQRRFNRGRIVSRKEARLHL